MAHSDTSTWGGLGESDLSRRNLWSNSHPTDNSKNKIENCLSQFKLKSNATWHDNFVNSF